jgi:pimeloyl-ACP methyl ester carboxylesterase
MDGHSLTKLERFGGAIRMHVKILIGLMIAVILLAFVGRHFLHRLLHPESQTFFSGTLRKAPPQPHGPGIEALSFAVAGATIESLFLPATDGAVGAKPLIIFAHGNSALIDDWLTDLDSFRQRGIGVLLVEYPGYGRSTGTPSEASIRAAFDSAFDRIITDSRVDASRIIGFGQSFGGAAICLLAADRPLRALILMSTFTALDISPPGGKAIPDHYNSMQAVSRYSGPLLVIHGRKDARIPWRQGQQLAAAAPHSTFLLYDCAHDCWHSNVLPFWHDATPFLAQAGIAVAAPLAH